MPTKTRLNRERVVQAAADLLNTEGIEALTLNRVADNLGIQPPSLYNHVDGLPGLYHQLALLNATNLGNCLSSVAIGKTGPNALEALANAYRAYIKEFPGLYTASLRASRNQDPPDQTLQAAEDHVVKVVLAVVESFGISGDKAMHAVRGLRSLVHGFATLEIAGGFGLPLDIDESFAHLVGLFVYGLQRKDENS